MPWGGAGGVRSERRRGWRERFALRSIFIGTVQARRHYIDDGRRSPQPPSTPPVFAKPRAYMRGFCFRYTALGPNIIGSALPYAASASSRGPGRVQQRRPLVNFVYGFGVAFVAAALLTIVWRYEPNPFIAGFLTAMIYLTGILAVLSKLG
jgi:hypothetical protein